MNVPGCETFLARHTEYVDGRMAAWEVGLWSAHLERCRDCARYDRVVREGGDLLRSLSTETVSEDFAFGLRHRLQHAREEERERTYGSGASAAAALLVAGVLAAIAWSPLVKELGPRLRAGSSQVVTDATGDASEVDDGPAIEEVTEPVANGSNAIDIHHAVAPLLRRNDVGAPEIMWIESPGRPPTPLFLGAIDAYVDRPGPFSPLVIAPPAFHLTSSVRTASSR